MTKWSFLVLVAVVASGTWLRLNGLPEAAIISSQLGGLGLSSASAAIWIIAIAGSLGSIVIYECLATLGWWRGGLLAAALYALSPGLIILSKTTDSTTLWSLGLLLLFFVVVRAMVALPLWHRSSSIQQHLSLLAVTAVVSLIILCSWFVWGNSRLDTGLIPAVILGLGILVDLLWLRWRPGIVPVVFVLAMVLGYLWANVLPIPLYRTYGEQQQIGHVLEQFQLTDVQAREIDSQGGIHPFSILSADDKVMADTSDQLDWNKPIIFVSPSNVLQTYPGMIVVPMNHYFLYVHFP